MKKILISVLSLSLIFSGCGQISPKNENIESPTGDTTVTAMSPAYQETETEPVSAPDFSHTSQADYVSMSFERRHFETFDQETGEKLLLNFDAAWPLVMISDNPDASEKITAALREDSSRFIKGYREEGDLYTPMGQEKAAEYAREDYPMRGDDFLPYAVERTYEITRGDDAVLSVMAQDYMYMGGAHGSCMRKYLVFDTKTGDRLSFSDLSEGPNGLWAKIMEVVRTLAAEDPDISGRINLEENQLEAALAALIRDGSWFFEGDFLMLESQEYELGAYAAGMVRFPMSMEDLKNDLKEKYRPAHQERGDLILTEKTDLLAIDLIQQGEYPAELYLEAGNPVTHVKVFTLEPYANGEDIHRGRVLWAAGQMKNCALQLLVEVPELIPNLGVEYVGVDGAPHTYAIAQSGEDGHYFLMELDLY